jgi:hypothetical protein
MALRLNQTLYAGGEMDEAQFWNIIELARAEGSIDLDKRVEALRAQLARLHSAEIQSFQCHYDAAIKWAYRWDLWAAARIMNGQCTPDGFRYFLDWLISEGRETYEIALQSPDNLADLAPIAYAENELFGYVALNVFATKTAENILVDLTAEAWPPAGDEWIDEDLPMLLPRLSKLYKDWDWLQQIRRSAFSISGRRTT